ncbi:hypothetical protein [Pollutibacter soli]|uniref:hypothetical protein n=1 Tax=Pollutibacter soli TaxID=3034157 RepID=UPI00301350A0
MSFLLPYDFKKSGLIITPAGLLLWILMQRGYTAKFSKFLFSTFPESFHHNFAVAVAVVSFFSFIIGLFFLSFSREKAEDEMIKKIRLDSFQLAALVQLMIMIAGFVCMVKWDPGKDGMMFFFIALILIFWLVYLIRFNYILHFRLR